MLRRQHTLRKLTQHLSGSQHPAKTAIIKALEGVDASARVRAIGSADSQNPPALTGCLAASPGAKRVRQAHHPGHHGGGHAEPSDFLCSLSRQIQAPGRAYSGKLPSVVGTKKCPL